MKNIYRYFPVILLAGFLMLIVQPSKAGNKDRSGQAGASELLINPWARSSGWGGVGTSCSRGLESIYSNVAGIAFTQRTELIFSNTQWLKGSDININNFGVSTKVSESGVLALSVMSMKFGDIDITEVDNPEGGIGTFSPSYMNINVGYAKAFSNSIYGGINFKVISEVISDVSAMGVAIDAGIQYVTGETENIKFGISLRNIGPTMKFRGDGLSIRVASPNGSGEYTVEQRSADFELPSQLNIGAAYDINLGEEHVITLAGNFASNSFTKDQFTGGIQYDMKGYLMLRGGYTYENGIDKDVTNPERSNVSKGFSGGATIQVPFNKEKGSSFAVDYSYRATDNFDGTHSIGARINF